MNKFKIYKIFVENENDLQKDYIVCSSVKKLKKNLTTTGVKILKIEECEKEEFAFIIEAIKNSNGESKIKEAVVKYLAS